MNRRLPDFLIIGAHKCGTTALYRTLQQHPQIFMSEVKEPRFFTYEDDPPTHLPPKDGIAYTRLEDYLALFDDAEDHQLIGEASPIYASWYRSRRTAQNIQRHCPRVKLVAVLRQPAERAWSEFHFCRRHGSEPLRSFESALAAEESPERENWHPDTFYFRTGQYGEILESYYELFDRSQIHIILYDEYEAKPEAELPALFRFLGVDPQYQADTKSRHNTGVRLRSRFLQHVSRRLQCAPANPAGRLLVRALNKFNRTPVPGLPSDQYERLTNRYRDDILKLQRLTGRDLSHWLV